MAERDLQQAHGKELPFTMGQQQAVQLPLVLDGRDRDDESIQKRLHQAQIESNEEYEEELLVSERNERYASLVRQPHTI